MAAEIEMRVGIAPVLCVVGGLFHTVLYYHKVSIFFCILHAARTLHACPHLGPSTMVGPRRGRVKET